MCEVVSTIPISWMIACKTNACTWTLTRTCITPLSQYSYNQRQGWCLTCVHTHPTAINVQVDYYSTHSILVTPMMFGWCNSCSSLISRSAVLFTPEKIMSVLYIHTLLVIGCRGHATDSYGFTSKIMVLYLLLTDFCIRCLKIAISN